VELDRDDFFGGKGADKCREGKLQKGRNWHSEAECTAEACTLLALPLGHLAQLKAQQDETGGRQAQQQDHQAHCTATAATITSITAATATATTTATAAATTAAATACNSKRRTSHVLISMTLYFEHIARMPGCQLHLIVGNAVNTA